MKVKLIIISVILLLVAVFVCGCSQFMENIGLINPTNEEQLSPEKASPDGLVKVLIGFKEKPGPAEQALVKGVGGKIKYTYHLIPAIAASVPEVAIEALKNNPNITNIEIDGIVYALDVDAELDNSWGVKRIGAGFVHDNDNKGAGIKVAIIDTGIDYNHPDLDANYVGGYDFVNDDTDPMDDAGHGTHVAGIVAAEDNDIDTSVVGVAPEADLYALKVLDETGSGYWSNVIAAIQWSVDNDNDMQVINMSLGGPGQSFALEEACDAAYVEGIVLVAAAGNGFRIIPAAFDSVIAVAASDSDDKIPGWSSKGSYIELTAPGVKVYSTWWLGDPEEGDYKYGSGTSMASPHVAGTVALMLKVGVYSRGTLQITADKLMRNEKAEYPDSWQGYGLVDAEEAVLGTDGGND